ncbi:hypothetical protein Bca101_093927 [Brassica carinata]
MDSSTFLAATSLDQGKPFPVSRQPSKQKKKTASANKAIKVRYISNPMKVKTCASKFRELVQELTGQDAVDQPEPVFSPSTVSDLSPSPPPPENLAPRVLDPEPFDDRVCEYFEPLDGEEMFLPQMSAVSSPANQTTSWLVHCHKRLQESKLLAVIASRRATGFLAKVLIEKLVRKSPEIGNIFILMKTQDQESANKRLYDEIISSDLFRLIKQTHWSSNEAFMKSNDEIDVIISCAGRTTFDYRYDSALNVNALGPGRLLSFGKGCKKLKLFLHISTAYVTGNKEGKILETPLCIGENITSHLNIETEMKLASEAVRKFYGREEIKKLKELGMERGDLPVVIIRPSIIESSYKEPFPGWLQGIRMSAPLILAYGKDHIADMWGDYKSSCDIIPVDMVANATIAAMAKHGCGVSEMKAYNVTSSSSHANLLRLGELMDFSQCVTLH